MLAPPHFFGTTGATTSVVLMMKHYEIRLNVISSMNDA